MNTKEKLWDFFEACEFNEKPREGLYDWGDYRDVINELKDELVDIFRKAKALDDALTVKNFDELNPVSIKGWKGVGFSSKKDFAIVKMMSQLESDSKRRYVGEKKLELIQAILDQSQGDNYFHPDGRYNVFKLVAEIREVLERNGLSMIRELLYPDQPCTQEAKQE